MCIVVFIPEQFGYYAHRFDVLKLCLGSLLAHTPRETIQIFVLDNGSCTEVREYLCDLRTRGHIDCLMLLGRNIGKINACRMLFEAAPGEVVAYSDDDIFFSTGWLNAQLKVLDTFPRVGMVSARPVRKQFGYGNAYLPAYLSEFPDVSVHHGHFIPDEWEVEFLRSTGCSVEGLASIKESRTDILLDYKGLKAYSTAAHFQFIALKSVILNGLKGGASRVTGSEERKVEESIDEMGFARLSTEERYVRHIGNVVSRQLLAEVGGSPSYTDSHAAWLPPHPLAAWLARPRLVRAVLRRLNEWSYKLLHYRSPG